MSFTGDLKHLPIIDIIQLLHQTRKTGTLCLRSQKGESQLVFKDGYIVSANHHNTSIRIGRILVEMGAVTEQVIEAAVREQGSGETRKPIVAILIESGHIDRKEAFKGLETLIELTIVEVLTWDEGTFTLDMTADIISDEYRYFPDNLHEEMVLDTQNVLMDALRIFDERNRDGQEVEEEWLSDDAFTLGEPDSPSAKVEDDTLSLEDLGLDSLDDLERKIPDVFIGLRDDVSGNVHGKVTGEPGRMPAASREEFVAYLNTGVREPDESQLLTLLHGHFCAMGRLTRAPEIALEILKLTSCLFERCLTLVVNGSELIAERSFGIRTERESGPAQALRFTIALGGGSSLFRDVIESGHLHCGQASDRLIHDHLFGEIGAPASPEILLLPLKCFGRTIALIYADFGKSTALRKETAVLEMAAKYGSLVIENAIYRSRHEKKP